MKSKTDRRKIDDVVNYSREAIRNAKLSIKVKRAEMDSAVEAADRIR